MIITTIANTTMIIIIITELVLYFIIDDVNCFLVIVAQRWTFDKNSATEHDLLS
jgi:hypothetical protein